MIDTNGIREDMEVIGADRRHVGTVTKVESHRIRLIKADDGGSPHQPGQTDHAADHKMCCIAGCSSPAGAAGPLPVAASLTDRVSAAMELGAALASADRVIAPALPPVGSRAPPRLG